MTREPIKLIMQLIRRWVLNWIYEQIILKPLFTTKTIKCSILLRFTKTWCSWYHLWRHNKYYRVSKLALFLFVKLCFLPWIELGKLVKNLLCNTHFEFFNLLVFWGKIEHLPKYPLIEFPEDFQIKCFNK